LAFEQHTRDWQAMDSTGTPDAAALESLIETIAREALPKAERLGDFNDEQIERSEAAHQRAVNRMTLGFAAVGGVGSLTGIVLGYTVAWSLRRSIHQLSVRVRDAADKLGQDLPTVTLIEDGDLHGLHHHMKGVVQEIERVVEQLQQRERELIRADQMAAVGQLAAGVAHELRNPLTSIKMLVQKNRRAAGAAGLPADNLKIIEHEIRRMERCLQTFLDFSRPSKPERRLTDLSTLIEHTFGLIEGRARNQQVRLQFNHPVDSSAVEVDADQIQQLLINLALNALDAMPRGGTLTFELAAGSMGHVELRASDTGCGISTTVMPRLFSPFVSGKETGLGLGLVVSRRIAEDHGGSLTANNRPGGGAYFTLRIPAAGEPVKL
jgi:signal transduction histidine kinase